MTASEVIAERERRLREDPEYRAAVEAAEAETARRQRERLHESEPVLKDLTKYGYSAENWRMGDAPPPDALPILMEHLGQNHPQHVLVWLATIVGEAGRSEVWDDLAERFSSTPAAQDEFKGALASTLAALARRQHLPQLREWLADPTHGPSRLLFYRAFTRLRASDRWEVVQAGLNDPDLHKEAQHLLHQRDLRMRRQPPRA